MEVAPKIHRLETPFGDRIVCLYLFVGEDHTLLIDSGVCETPKETLAPYLDEIGIGADKIRYVLTSHADFDHTAGNGAVKEMAPNALFICHRLDQAMVESVESLIDDRYDEYKEDHGIAMTDDEKEYIRANSLHVPVDVTVNGGETLRLGPDWEVEILHMPGHSRGHLSVYDPRSQSHVIADAALFNAVLTKEGQPAFPPTYRYVDSYVSTVDRIMGITATGLFTSHYPVYRGDAIADFLHESRSYVDRVDQCLHDHLSERGPCSLKELCDQLGSTLGEWPEAGNAFLNFPLLGHLERMVQYGQAATVARGDVVAYTLT